MELKENIIRFHHVCIKAQDITETVTFYKQFGFEEVHHWSLPEFELEMCVMLYHRGLDCHLEICDQNASIPTQGRKRYPEEEYVENALLHLCFMVKDVAEAMQQAISYGAKPLSKEVWEINLKNEKKTVTVNNGLVYSPNGEVIEFIKELSF
ncbi:VOC family protein [Sphingobacterium spiritivorum]|uniref:VOC family protein n=1 Tax=Sphingobacterium spiritivorum TaxID=258 RepID=UPI003DA6208C